MKKNVFMALLVSALFSGMSFAKVSKAHDCSKETDAAKKAACEAKAAKAGHKAEKPAAMHEEHAAAPAAEVAPAPAK